jgi:hypothetical protein
MVKEYYLSVSLVGGGTGTHKHVAGVRVTMDKTSYKQLMTESRNNFTSYL